MVAISIRVSNKNLMQQLKIHVKIDSGMGRIGLRDAGCSSVPYVGRRIVLNRYYWMVSSHTLLVQMKKIPKVRKNNFRQFMELS